MGTSLALVPRAELSAYAVPAGQLRLPRARRTLLLAVANVVAVALAFGALHVLGSAVVTQTSDVAPTQAEAREAPIVAAEAIAPRLRPETRIADAATLFAPPVFVGKSLRPINPTAFSDRFVTSASVAQSEPSEPVVAEAPVAETPSRPRAFVPPAVSKLVSIAGVGRTGGERSVSVAVADPDSVGATVDVRRNQVAANVAIGNTSLSVDTSNRVVSSAAAAVSSTVSTTTATVGSVLGSASGLLN